MPDPSAPGLRERKKLRTREAIQREAFRLFSEKGFAGTSVEEIAEAADVSPSTFFNYFPSKVDVVMEDDLDPLILAAFHEQPRELGAIEALRRSMAAVFNSMPADAEALMRRRVALLAADEDLRAALLAQFAALIDQVAEVVASRAGHDPRDFRVRNLAGALLGVMMAVMLAAADDPDADLVGLLDTAVAHLEAGLPLG